MTVKCKNCGYDAQFEHNDTKGEIWCTNCAYLFDTDPYDSKIGF